MIVATTVQCRPSAVKVKDEMNDGMSEMATPGHSAVSPSGRFRLIVFDDRVGGLPVQGFRVEDMLGQSVLAPTERWSVRHRLYFLWDQQERVWAYSSDVGTSIWEPDDATWRQCPFAGSGLQAPDLLRRAIPSIFP